jgi:aarF domain-containing kinase
VTEEDKCAVENVAVVLEFLLASSGSNSETLRQVAPLLPEVAMQMLPEIFSRLVSRIGARTLRELYLLPS